MQTNELNKYLTTLQTSKEDKKPFVKLPISNYSELGFFINSLLSVCIEGLNYSAYSGTEHKPEPLEYVQILEVIKELIPHSELELLSQLKENKPLKL